MKIEPVPMTDWAFYPNSALAWIDAHLEVSTTHGVNAKQLFQAYLEWCHETGEQPVSPKRMGMILADRGFRRAKRNTGYFWMAVPKGEAEER